jgi:hypothetical protein
VAVEANGRSADRSGKLQLVIFDHFANSKNHDHSIFLEICIGACKRTQPSHCEEFRGSLHEMARGRPSGSEWPVKTEKSAD